MIAFEYALPAGALALYLHDCCMLLYANALLCVGSRGRWRIVIGSALTLFGKRVCLGAPFQPWVMMFHGTWSEERVPAAPPQEWPAAQFSAALLPVRVLATLLLVLLLALPVIVLVGEQVAQRLLLTFAIYYVLIVISLTVIFLRRNALALRPRQFWMLSFDVIACAPFAVNLVRKVSLLQPLPGDPILFTRVHLEGERQRTALALLAARIGEFLQSAEPGSEQELQLQALHARTLQEPQ